MLRDRDIRQALWTKLATDLRQCAPALALQELPVNSRCGFADVVTINHELVGYEIKSDVDSTRRLADQITIYNDLFDRFYCVTTKRHYGRVRQIIPKWWGILIAAGEPVTISQRRQSRRNPGLIIDVVLYLLYRDELAKLAQKHGVRGYYKDDKCALAERLAQVLEHGLLRAEVRHVLQNRPVDFWSQRQRSFAGLEIRF